MVRQKTHLSQPISKFQEEKRDLAFVMDKNISCGDVENCIREANKYVKEIRLFDVYEGGQIPEAQEEHGVHRHLCTEGRSI